MDHMFESSTSEGIQLGKRPASSSAALERRGKKRAAEEEEGTHRILHLMVKSQDKEISFKVKPTIKLEKILKIFCEKARVEYRTMRFLFDGSRVPLMATPDELNMNDGDIIQAMGWQVGGGGDSAFV